MLSGAAFSYPCMLSQCPVNVLNALRNRHLSVAPNRCVARLVNPFLTVLKEHCKQVAYARWPELANGEWRIGKPLGKLMNIDRSRLFDRVAPNKAKSFAKREVNVAVPSKARLIQGNHNELTAYEHPEEYAVMTAVLKAVRDKEFVWCGVSCKFVYAGGLDHQALSEILTEESRAFPTVVYDERDGKNWDATMNESLLRSEAFVYEMLGLAAATRFLQRSAKVVGTCVTKVPGRTVRIKYKTAWKRLSGDWNTSVGNTIISMIIVFTVIQGLPEHLRPKRWCGLFMGDDYLGIMGYGGRPCLVTLAKALNDLESSCGITPIRGLFLDPLQISFISLGVWPRFDGGYQFVPKPGKQLAKLFWAKDDKYRNYVRDYASAIAQSFWHTYHGFPLMMSFLKLHFVRKPRQIALDPYIVDPLVAVGAEVDWRTGFVWKYRIPFDALSFQVPEFGVWHHPAVKMMIDLESLDPQDRRGCLAS